MDLVQVKITKDNNMLTYVKIIREFDKTIPVTEIKKRIEDNHVVHEFYLHSREWMSVENLTEFEWHMKYFQFLKKLEKAGANLDIFLNGELESMQLLNNWIHTIKKISDDCNQYPD